jgi:hypothetical protein
VIPRILIFGRNRDTIRAVEPVNVQTTIAFAFKSFASVAAECDNASDGLVIENLSIF